MNSFQMMEEFLTLVSVVTTVSSAVLWYANKELSKDLRQLKRDVDALVERQAMVLSTEFQRQIDFNKLEIGLMKARVQDLEGFVKKQGYIPRADFPPGSMPSRNSDFC